MIQPQKYPTICDYTLTISHDISVIHDVKHHETPMQKLEVLIPMLKKYTGNGGSVIIPNGVTSIHDWAFWRCTHLTDVTLLDSVKSIDICAFEECKSLKSIILPNSITSIGCGAFKDCESLASITLPNSVVSISDRVFSGCKNLKSVTIPKRLEAAISHYKSIEKISYTDSADNSL